MIRPAGLLPSALSPNRWVLIRLAAGLALAAVLIPAARAEPPSLYGSYQQGKGDLNGDGRVTLGDAVLADRLITHTGTFTPAQQAAADANGDGSVTIDDAALILQEAIYLEGEPAGNPSWQARPGGNVMVSWGTISDGPSGHGVTVTFATDDRVKDLAGYSVLVSYPPRIESLFLQGTGSPEIDIDGTAIEQDTKGDIYHPNVSVGVSPGGFAAIAPFPLAGPIRLGEVTFRFPVNVPLPRPSTFRVVRAEAVDINGDPLPLGVVSAHWGDDDVNGELDMGDVILSLQMALGLWPAAPQNDVDGDGRATSADTLRILKAVLANQPIYRN